MPSSTLHNRESSFRESLIEHMFVGELLKYSWQMARQTDAKLIEISRAEEVAISLDHCEPTERGAAALLCWTRAT